MSNYLTAFVATAESFSAEFKLFGQEPVVGVENSIEVVSCRLDHDVFCKMIDDLVPRVCALAARSPDPKDQMAGQVLRREVEMQEYAFEVLISLIQFTLTINNDLNGSSTH